MSSDPNRPRKRLDLNQLGHAIVGKLTGTVPREEGDDVAPASREADGDDVADQDAVVGQPARQGTAARG